MLLNIQMMNLRQSKELLDNMKEDNILYQKKTLEDNANYDIYTKEKRTFNQCFKTRPGPAGQPGTRPARPYPAETRVYFFLYSYARNDVVLAFYN
jgi:hypothetical protein